MKTPRYKLLRGEMYAHDIDQQILGEKIGKSRGYVGERLCGKREWSMADVYTLCRLFDIPHERIPEYFPPKEPTRRTAQGGTS